MIVVFGSINADVVVPVQSLPRPGETVLGGDYSLLAGGKGANQAIAARRAGAEVVIAGAVGRDGFAAVALDPLQEAQIDTRFVRAVDAPTGCALIMVAQGGENIIAVASGANAAVRHDQVPDTLLTRDMILVAQMEVPYPETAAMIHRVRAAGGRVLLNLAPARAIEPGLLREIDLVVANRHEAAALGTDPPGIGNALRQGLIVTRGAAGATAYLTGGIELSVPALSVEALDTTGAGDTFVGVLAAALDLGASLEIGLWRASAAAGLACRARGAQSAMPDAAAIDDALTQMPRG